MNRPVTGLLLILAILGLALWTLVEPSDLASESMGEAGPPSTITARLSAGAPDASRTELPGIVDQASDGIPVLVVDEAGSPIPDAEVLYLPREPIYAELSPREQLEWSRLVDRTALCRRHGERTTSNHNGIAYLDAESVPTPAVAFTETRHGETVLRFDRTEPPGGWRIELRLERTVVARVTQLGTPIRAVAVYARFKQENRNGSLRDVERAVGLTDSRGVVEIPHLQSWSIAPVDGHRSVSLRVWVTGAFGEAVVLDLDALPSDIVELTCPPTGSISVRAVTPLGEIWQPAFLRKLGGPTYYVDLQPMGSEPMPPAEDWHRELLDDGSLEFSRVALGLRWSAGTMYGDREVVEEFDGPRQPGEHVAIELRPESDSTVIVGRALDERGVPLALGEFEVELTDERVSNRSEVVTDADGRFWWMLAETVRDVVASVRIELVEGERLSGRAAATATEVTLSPGLNRLGDFTLQPAPLIVSAHLVDESDKPVRLEPRVEHAVVGDNWKPLDREVLWREDDSFELRGRVEGRTRVVIPSAPDTPPFEFAAGSSGLRIPVVSPAIVRIEVQHDRGVDGYRLEYRLTTPEGRELRGLAIDTDGETTRWMFHGVARGRYRFELGTFADVDPIATVEAIDVQSGGILEDPRMRFDLRGKLRRVTVRFVDEHGDPRDCTGGRLRQSDLTQRAHFVRGTSTVLLTARDRVRATVDVPGCAPAAVDTTANEATVTISR